MATKEELLERARELEVEGRSSMSKEELEKAVANAERSSGDEVADGSERGFEREGSDLDDPEVKAELSPSGQEAAEKLDDASADLANAAMDASGPLHLQSPEDRIMTGAVNEEQAEEQRKLLEENMGDEGHAGHFTEAGQPLSTGLYDEQDAARAKGEQKDNLHESDDRELHEVRQEHVIDFPPPVGQREGTTSRSQDRAEDSAEERNPDLAYAEPGGAPLGNPVIGAGSRVGDVYSQKGVLYTDGLSGHADHNLERAYEIPELLQSSDAGERKAGDESLSEAAKEQKDENLSAHEKEAEQSAKSEDSDSEE